MSTSPPGGPPPEPLPSRLDDIRRSERTMILVRWAGVAFALAQVLAYREFPYPPGIKAAALGLSAGLAVANVVIWWLSTRTSTLRRATALSLGAFAVDILVTSGFIWLYAFDPSTALWAVVYIVPLEGAIRFQLPGALGGWAIGTVLYVGRELFRVQVFPESVSRPGGFGFQIESISFRMGIGLLIALVAGLMARNLTRQRARLAGTLEELSRTDALRARLVAMLAHDVRGPLTTIRGTFKTLSRYGDRLDGPTREELLRSADRQATRLQRLASDLLDLARLERGRLELHMEDVRLGEAVARGLSYADDGRRFEIRVDPDLVVRADRERLEQIIVNLAANAVRHGRPPFVIEGARGGDGKVDLRFRDEGPGVPGPDRSGLFEPFRVDIQRGSVGLGLAIVRALAEAQGGEVSYQDNAPRGACFTVSLIAAPAGSS